MTSRLLSLYGFKHNPFRPDVPTEALYVPQTVDAFLRRVEVGLAQGGFAMLTGDPGTGKSIALRLLAARLSALSDVVVGTIEHPQSRPGDFYRELGDLFGVPLIAHNRWAGFKALRTRWTEHFATTLRRPVLILDEAQETTSPVLNELRILASKDVPAARSPSGGRGRRSPRSRAWMQLVQLGAVCCSAGGGGTVRSPTSRASWMGSSRARVAAQYLGASSRNRSFGQWARTRSRSRR
jgi:ABC-type transport system involved in cytochrome c biogenesis ATPase subunit